MLVTQRTDLAIPEGERMARLTDQFLLELRSVASDKVVVVFLDALEKAAETTQQWVWSELLEAVRDGRLENVRFVIGGRNQPTVKDEWKALVEERQLKPLEESHVKELLIKREVPPEQAEYMAKFLLVASGGVPLKLASIVEAALRSHQDFLNMTDFVSSFSKFVKDLSTSSLQESDLSLMQLDPVHAERLRRCAISHAFDTEILRVLEPELGVAEAEETMRAFELVPAVIRLPTCLALHDIGPERALRNMAAARTPRRVQHPVTSPCGTLSAAGR